MSQAGSLLAHAMLQLLPASHYVKQGRYNRVNKLDDTRATWQLDLQVANMTVHFPLKNTTVHIANTMSEIMYISQT